MGPRLGVSHAPAESAFRFAGAVDYFRVRRLP